MFIVWNQIPTPGKNVIILDGWNGLDRTWRQGLLNNNLKIISPIIVSLSLFLSQNAIIFVSKMIVNVKKGQIFMALLVTCTFPKAQERKLVYQCTLSYC